MFVDSAGGGYRNGEGFIESRFYKINLVSFGGFCGNLDSRLLLKIFNNYKIFLRSFSMIENNTRRKFFKNSAIISTALAFGGSKVFIDSIKESMKDSIKDSNLI